MRMRSSNVVKINILFVVVVLAITMKKRKNSAIYVLTTHTLSVVRTA